MSYLFKISFLMIMSTWLIYPLVLFMLTRIRNNKEDGVLESEFSPGVSVILAAHNEQDNLFKRCENIFSQNYSGEIEVVIASDGSTDGTVDILPKLKNKYSSIIFKNIQPQGGKANAHNHVVKCASHNILVFTDAETIFEKDCLLNLITPFYDNRVGFVSGSLKFRNLQSNAVSESVGLYWKFEMFLRSAESALGLYATGTGACCAVRKSLYKKIPITGDVDFITPIDVVLNRKKCIHSSSAIAWDELPNSPKKEFKARIRMTSKNFKGTLGRWGMASIFKHPIYSLAIFFHKIGRWLTPYFLIMLLFSNFFLLNDGWPYISLILLQLIFYTMAFLGWAGISVLYSFQIYSFVLANIGFFWGILNATFGKVPHLYQPVGQQK